MYTSTYYNTTAYWAPWNLGAMDVGAMELSACPAFANQDKGVYDLMRVTNKLIYNFLELGNQIIGIIESAFHHRINGKPSSQIVVERVLRNFRFTPSCIL